MLAQDYDSLQVILAYNTPVDLPVEDELRAIADRDARFTALRIHGSVSKAQNVNAVIKRVTGEFVAIFDADHHPAPGSFKRAWRWLAKDADVVQGHCVVRNGTDGKLQQLIAAEFEAMYAVSHPGRARLHGFGIFGGSNGYWRTSVLRLTRLRSFMLTEDIDSSMRVIAAGGRIVSDPGLRSTELAPGSWGALWGQRLRWAQGWSQVSLRYLWDGLRNRQLSVRQKARPDVPPRLARDLSLDLAPDLPDPRLLAAAWRAAGDLVRARVRRDDALHVQRRPRPGVELPGASPLPTCGGAGAGSSSTGSSPSSSTSSSRT